MYDKLVIMGAGGHGKVAADVAINMKKWKHILFLDDDIQKTICSKHAIVGTFSEATRFLHEAQFFVAVGDADKRSAVQEQLKKYGAVVATLIHPDAVIGENVKIGEGSIVMAGCVINTDAIIGRGCIINTCASVDHDCRIADYAHIAVGAHLAGEVRIGNSTWVGAGVTVVNRIKVSEKCIVGAGATVVSDICEPGIYLGTPAKRKHINNKKDFGGGYSPSRRFCAAFPAISNWRDVA